MIRKKKPDYAPRNFVYRWSERSSLEKELRKPISYISLTIHREEWGPSAVTLWRANGQGLTVSSEANDVALCLEIGVLRFRFRTRVDPGEVFLKTPGAFARGTTPLKLLIKESGTTAESGLILTAPDGCQIFIVSGASPFTVAIRGDVDLTPEFNPEYPFDCYEKAAMN